jgi:hypothetical protein
MSYQSVPAMLSSPADDLHRKSHILHGQSHVAFLSNSKHLLVTNGPEVKVFSNDSSALSNFSNYPQFPEDFVGLRLTVADLDFLLDNMNWQAFE